MHGGPANNSILCNSRVCHTHRNSSSNVSSVIDHSTPPLYPSPQKNIRCIHFSIDIQYFYHFIHLHYIHTGSIRRVKVLDLPYCWLLESPCWSHLPSSQVASLTKKRGGVWELIMYRGETVMPKTDKGHTDALQFAPSQHCKPTQGKENRRIDRRQAGRVNA
jgi:hypothetical protein